MLCKAKNIERAVQAQLLCNIINLRPMVVLSWIPRQVKHRVHAAECETRKSKGICRVRHYYVGITIASFP